MAKARRPLSFAITLLGFLLITAAPMPCSAAGVVEVGNEFVRARVNDAGLITFYSNGISISFQDESKLTVKIGGKDDTNNSFAEIPRLSDGQFYSFETKTTVVHDTATTIFHDVNGVDVLKRFIPSTLATTVRLSFVFGALIFHLRYVSSA